MMIHIKQIIIEKKDMQIVERFLKKYNIVLNDKIQLNSKKIQKITI